MPRGAARLRSAVRRRRGARRSRGRRLSGAIRGGGRTARRAGPSPDSRPTSARSRRPARAPISRCACAASSSTEARRPTSRGASSPAGPCARGGGSARGAGFSIALDFITYQYVNDAGLAATGPSFGPATVGYHLVLATGARAAVAAYARALLPIATDRQSGIETGLELGASGRARLSRRWLVDGGLSLAGPLFVTGGQSARSAPACGSGRGLVRPQARVRAFLREEASGREVAPTFTLLSVAPRAGMRSALAHGLCAGVSGRGPGGGGRPHQRHRQPLLGMDPLIGAPRWVYGRVHGVAWNLLPQGPRSIYFRAPPWPRSR